MNALIEAPFLLNNGMGSLFGLIIYFRYYGLESNPLLTIHESVVVFQWSGVHVIQLFSVVCVLLIFNSITFLVAAVNV
jgi:hypothetical protein